jgi:hypothetical protein
MASLRVWITPDKAWRIDVRPDGRWSVIHRSMPMAAGRGGVPAARAALEALPDAPGWDAFTED